MMMMMTTRGKEDALLTDLRFVNQTFPIRLSKISWWGRVCVRW